MSIVDPVIVVVLCHVICCNGAVSKRRYWPERGREGEGREKEVAEVIKLELDRDKGWHCINKKVTCY